MAVIEKRDNKNGSSSYRVIIRKKGLDIHKTFKTEEDAKLYEFYRERLIDNMENFDVDLSKRVNIINIFELKMKTLPKSNKREINDFKSSLERLQAYFGERYLSEISYDDWLEISKKLLNSHVYKGAKTENGKRLMSPKTLLKIISHASSCITHINNMGVALDNHPMLVIRTFIRPLINKSGEVGLEPTT